eukprot:14301825-Heterocapsa_arctica.AAC.1
MSSLLSASFFRGAGGTVKFMSECLGVFERLVAERVQEEALGTAPLLATSAGCWSEDAEEVIPIPRFSVLGAAALHLEVRRQEGLAAYPSQLAFSPH